MSENITHMAVLDDCFRIVLNLEKVHPALHEVVRTQRDIARLGTITRGGDSHTVQLLESFRQRWATRQPEDRLEAKLAFVLGWLCHRAADRQMKPLFREVEPGRPVSPAECSIYHDAFLFHEVYADGREQPYQPRMFDFLNLSREAGLNPDAVMEVVHAAFSRALLELHTFSPNPQDAEGWIDRLFKLQQVFRVDIERYARAIASPDPDKVRRFIIDTNFYDRQEPIIRVARAIQRNQPVEPSEVASAAEAAAQTHYGKAVKMSVDYIRAASEFLERQISRDGLGQRLNIGKLGRDNEIV